MDITQVRTENNEFLIELTKEKRYFGYSEYGNYICHIKFIDLINRPVLDIVTNESQLAALMNLLYNDEVVLSGLYNVIEFNSDMYLTIMCSESPLCPCEDDPTIYFQIFQKDPLYGNASRLYLPVSLEFKDNLVFAIYQLLEDIPNFKDLKYKDLNDYGMYYDFMDIQ